VRRQHAGRGQGRQLNPLKGVHFAATGLREVKRGIDSHINLNYISFLAFRSTGRVSFCVVSHGFTGLVV